MKKILCLVLLMVTSFAFAQSNATYRSSVTWDTPTDSFTTSFYDLALTTTAVSEPQLDSNYSDTIPMSGLIGKVKTTNIVVKFNSIVSSNLISGPYVIWVRRGAIYSSDTNAFLTGWARLDFNWINSPLPPTNVRIRAN